MRVDKNDRYVSEKANKNSTTSFKLPSLFQDFPKRKLIILGFAVIMIFISLILMIYSYSKQSKRTELTPSVINDLPSTNFDSDNNTSSSLTKRESIATNNSQAISSKSQTNSQTETTLNQTSGKQEQLKNIKNITNKGKDIDNRNIKSNMDSLIADENNGVSSLNNKFSSQIISNNYPLTEESSHKGENTKLDKNSNLEDNYYAIQLSASSSAENLKKFAIQNNISNYQIYKTKHNNSTWFVLIEGNYSSYDEANRAIKSLPNALQKNNPWVKSSAAINKEKAVK
jgi:DamX protein